MRKLICASFLVLAGCVSTTTTQSPSQPQPQAQSAQSKATTPTAAQVSRFKT
ncbi:MAG TPA: peptidase M48, partial [Roseovarius nubinhibens]|nr:peptidase M48 [Roseovarius nubinhibens]